MDGEIKSIEKNRTCQFTDLPKGKEAIDFNGFSGPSLMKMEVYRSIRRAWLRRGIFSTVWREF